MVLSHVTDSWTRDADRRVEPFYTLVFIAGVASSLFLFLAGAATALLVAAKGRGQGGPATAARLARRRGWQIFALGLLFRVQSQLLSLGPVESLFKVDMLNTMGLSIVAVSYVWQLGRTRAERIYAMALLTAAIAMVTPLVRQAAWLAALPDPLEAYLRPAGGYAAFPLFAWAGFVFAGALVGDLIDAVRQRPERQLLLQNGIVLCAGAGVMGAWGASFLPSIYETARFWQDSPTFFFIRLGLASLLVPTAWIVEQLLPRGLFQPMVTMGRSSLFVYWIHVELVYGVVAEPLKRAVPLWVALVATIALTSFLYGVTLVKNRLMAGRELRGPFRLLAPVLR